jgi:hypothetical protein
MKTRAVFHCGFCGAFVPTEVQSPFREYISTQMTRMLRIITDKNYQRKSFQSV